MSVRARSTLSAGISILCSKRWQAGTKTLPKTSSHSRRPLNAARLRSFLLVCVTPSICLTTRNSSSARRCPSVSPQIPPIGACFCTAQSSIRSCESALPEPSDKRAQPATTQFPCPNLSDKQSAQFGVRNDANRKRVVRNNGPFAIHSRKWTLSITMKSQAASVETLRTTAPGLLRNFLHEIVGVSAMNSFVNLRGVFASSARRVSRSGATSFLSLLRRRYRGGGRMRCSDFNQDLSASPSLNKSQSRGHRFRAHYEQMPKENSTLCLRRCFGLSTQSRSFSPEAVIFRYDRYCRPTYSGPMKSGSNSNGNHSTISHY